MCGIYYLIRWVRWTHEHILRWSPIISSFIFRSPLTHIRTTWLDILIDFCVSNFFKLISSFMLSSPKFLYISSCFFFNLFHELKRFVIAAEDRLSLSYDFPFLQGAKFQMPAKVGTEDVYLKIASYNDYTVYLTNFLNRYLFVKSGYETFAEMFLWKSRSKLGNCI